MTQKSKLSKDLEKAAKAADAFEESVKEMTFDRANEAAAKETTPQTQMSQAEIKKSKGVYLKPKRTISSREKFNSSFEKEYNYKKEYVSFIAENKEIIGETLDFWTKPFAGVPAEEWEVPVNKVVWAPRYVAEQIKGCKYHKFSMEDKPTTVEGDMTYYGSMVVDNTVQRLDAQPVNTERTSVFT